MIVVNGHFGNQAPLEQAARALVIESALPVLVLNYPGLETLASEVCESKPAAPTFYHADEVETALVLATLPEVVHMDLATAEYPIFPASFGAEPIRLDTFCDSGVFGDPRSATPEKGERLYAGLVDSCLNVVRSFLQRHGLQHQKQGPQS